MRHNDETPVCGKGMRLVQGGGWIQNANANKRNGLVGERCEELLSKEGEREYESCTQVDLGS